MLFLLLGCDLTGKIVVESIPVGDDSGPVDDSSEPTDDSKEPDDSEPPDSPIDTSPDVEPALPDLLVDCNGGGDTTTIQEAIEQVVSPARIAVAPCEYRERLDFLGKIIDLYGIEGSARTTLNAGQGGTAVDFEVFESGWSRMAGFTIEGGYDPGDAAGMEITGASVELEDIVFTDNSGYSIVRGIGASVDMVNVYFENNDISSSGQAIIVDSGSLVISNSFIDCSGGSQGIWHHVQLILSETTIVCESGYGVYDYHGEDYVIRSTIYGGLSGYYAADTESTEEEPDSPTERFIVENSVIGGGQIGAEVLYMDLDLVNSVFYGTTSALSMTECNSASESMNNVFVGGDCGITGDQNFSDSYSAFWGNTEDGCGIRVTPEVSGDPMFVDFPDDVSLRAGSPLIDAGSPSLDDTDGSRSDIGRFGGPMGAW